VLIPAVGWVSLALGVASFTIFCITLYLSAQARAPMSERVLGGAEGVARLAEALAKVIDAFAKAGPTVSALVASLVFVGLSVWVALHGYKIAECGKPPTVEKPVAALTGRCVVAGLPEPNTHGQSQVSEAGLIDLSGGDVTEIPRRCLDSVVDHALQDQPILLLIEGRPDKRPLRSGLKRIYVDNFTLAYQRGLSLKAYLVDRYRDRLPPAAGKDEQVKTFSSRIAVTAGGPNHIGGDTTTSDMSDDRAVEVFSYWNTKSIPE
jgi:hypothetical protein